MKQHCKTCGLHVWYDGPICVVLGEDHYCDEQSHCVLWRSPDKCKEPPNPFEKALDELEKWLEIKLSTFPEKSDLTAQGRTAYFEINKILNKLRELKSGGGRNEE